jgi:hypothetical protein
MAAIQAVAAAAGQCENDPNDRPTGVTEREADKRPTRAQDHGAGHFTEPEGLPGQGYREQQREDQVGGQQGLDKRQLEVAYRPGGEHLAQHHARNAGQPAWLPEQVRDQPDAQETRIRLHLGRVLLQDEAGSDQERRQQGARAVEAEVDVHDLGQWG